MKNIFYAMKIQSLTEFNCMRQRRRIKELPIVNESISLKGTLIESNDVKATGAIVLPTFVNSQGDVSCLIREIIDSYVVEHFLVDEQFTCEIGDLLCGEYVNDEITYNEQSICVVVTGRLADSKILREIALIIIDSLDIAKALVITDDSRMEIERMDEEARRIRRIGEL